MNKIRIAVLASLLLGSTAAVAGTEFSVTVAASKAAAGGAEACSSKASAHDATTDDVSVEIDAALKTDLVLSIDGGGAPVVLKAGATRAKFPPATYGNNRLLVMTGGKKVCELMLAPPPSRDAKVAAAADQEPGDNRSFARVDRLARQFLAHEHIVDHRVHRDSSFGRTFRIYHLPSGVPAFPLPRHVNEKDDVEIWMVLPEGATASVDVSACDKVPVTRVAGRYQPPPGIKQSGEGTRLTRAPTFRLEGYAHKLSCAGTLTYKIEVVDDDAQVATSTSIEFDPVYRFEWGLGFMFDFARPRSLTLGDRPTEDGMGTEKFVIESKDYTGAKPVIALSINVCGTNPRALTWCDRLLNPTLLIDPSRLTSGFGGGLVLRPFHGFGVLAGLTVFKSTALADGVVAEVGDRWTAAGDPPTKQVFNRDSLGFVLALVVSTDVFAELTKKD